VRGKISMSRVMKIPPVGAGLKPAHVMAGLVGAIRKSPDDVWQGADVARQELILWLGTEVGE
jgi:hypothetical protein